MITCDFCDDHDPETLLPRGKRCGAPATQRIDWVDRRVSFGCDAHGLLALDNLARWLVARIVRIDDAT